MRIFKQSLVKNLIFLLIYPAMVGLFGFISITDQALAATEQNQEIRQVKIASNPAVYYLDHSRGLRKVYITSTAYLSYGNKWSDIKVISQAELDKWSEAHLVKTQNSNRVYYINQGQKAWIESAEQFIEAGFKWSDVVTVNQVDLDEYKTTDFNLAQIVGNNNDNSLSIILDASSPTAGYLVIGTQDNLAAVFSLRALSRPVEIRKLVLDLKGVFNSALIKEIYLTTENNLEYPVSAVANNRQADFNFNNQPIVIRPGEINKIKVYVNFYDSSADILNHTLQIAINQPSNITGARASGAFPLAGETFKLTSGGGILEKVTAGEQTLSLNNNQAIIGSTDKIIGKFNLAETSGQADVFIKELKFANQGNAAAASLNNFRLKNRAGQVIATIAQMNGARELIYKLNYKIKKGSNETFTILANVAGGENSTIELYLDKVQVLSSQGDFNLPVQITNLNELITIKREALGVLAKELKVNSRVFTEHKGVIIGNFEIRNNNQKITLNRLSFSLEKGSATPGLTETVYLVDYKSGKVSGYINGNSFNNGTVNVDLGGLALKAKQNLALALIAQIPESAPNGGYYKTILNSINYRADSGLLFSDTVNNPGARLIVNKSNLYLYPNNSLSDQAYIKGQKNIKIASFIIENAAGGDTKITDLTFSRGTDTSGTISYDNGFSNLRFYIGSSRIKTIKDPYSGDFVVNNFNYILRSGNRAEIKVYVDTDRDLETSMVQLAISGLAAVNTNSLIPATVYNLNVNSFKVGFGQVSAEISRVADGFVTQGVDDNVIAGFKVKNSGAEDIRLGVITINSVDQELTYSLGYSNLRVVSRDQQRTIGTIRQPVSGANKINLGGYVIKAGEEEIFDVQVKTSNLVADQNVNIYFSNFTAQGRTSKISALISGDPTASFDFAIALGGSR